MEVISLAKLARGGSATLELDRRGRPLNPLLVVDLDDLIGLSDIPAVARQLRNLSRLVVGIATGPVSAAIHLMMSHLTCVLAPEETTTAIAGSPDDLQGIAETVAEEPYAALLLAQVLAAARPGEAAAAGLWRESTAYGLLQSGEGFRRWVANKHPAQAPADCSVVSVERLGSTLHVTLSDPRHHNAFSSRMRDELFAALEVAAADPAVEVVLRGEGVSFCSGGHLAEFGATTDAALAHLIRTTRSAGAMIDAMRERVTVEVHGATIGAGIELAAFAGHVSACPDTWFQLPEVGYGLIPGAGGTVSIPRRIGRWRTAYMALTGARVDAARALRWGLVDSVTG